MMGQGAMLLLGYGALSYCAFCDYTKGVHHATTWRVFGG